MTDEQRIQNLANAAHEERRAETLIIQDECTDGFHGACPDHLVRCDCSCHKGEK